MIAPRVALAITSTDAMRTPVTMTGSASGSCTWPMICQRLRPMPRAASVIAGLTAMIPAWVLISIGGIARIVSAMSAGRKPTPIKGSMAAMMARLGIARRAPMPFVTACDAPRLCALRIPRGKAIISAASRATPLSVRWAPVLAQKSG